MSKYLYQPGDAVRVRSDLSEDTVYAMKSGDDTVPGCLARLRSSLYMVAATSFVSLIALAKINTVTTGHSTLQLAL